MKRNRNAAYVLFIVLIFTSACNKSKHRHDDDDSPIVPIGALRSVTYSVKGTNFNVSFIDSNTIYKVNQVYKDSFVYEFRKGSGAGIGMTVSPQSTSDTVYSWRITIDGALYANAFSEGGAFFNIPYK